MLISLSVRPAVRPGSLEMVQNQIATAHLPKSLLAPEPPPCLSVSPWKVALHPNKDLCLWKDLAFKSPSVVQIVFPWASFCLPVGCEDVEA